MTTPLRVPWSRRSAKQYILAALLGTLATVAVVASISISLAPAHIAFFVLEANVTNANKPTPEGKQLLHSYYNLTLGANNTSHHTAVSYGSLAVSIWRSETAWIPTEEVDTSAALPGWLWPGNSTSVKVGVEWCQYDEETTPAANEAKPPPPPPPPQGSSNSSSGGVPKWPEYRVVVEAKVWFRFAGVPTLPYTVKVSCFPVNFLDDTNSQIHLCGRSRDPYVVNDN